MLWPGWSLFFFWSSLSKPLGAVPSSASAVSIFIILISHSFPNSGKVQLVVYLFAFFIFNLWSDGTVTFTWRLILIFLFINTRFGFPTRSWWLKVLENFMCLIFSDSFYVCAYAICKHSKTLVSFTFSTGLSFPPSHIYTCFPYSRCLLRN